MNKFIDVDKLLAEMGKLLKSAENEEKEAFAKLDAEGHLVAVTKTAICTKVVGIINSLQQEQLEADLEKLVNEEFASRSRATERGLEVATIAPNSPGLSREWHWCLMQERRNNYE